MVYESLLCLEFFFSFTSTIWNGVDNYQYIGIWILVVQIQRDNYDIYKLLY